jgi:hypothetical protein
VGNAIGQRIEVAFGLGAQPQLPRKPVLINVAIAGLQELVDAADKMGMLGV